MAGAGEVAGSIVEAEVVGHSRVLWVSGSQGHAPHPRGQHKLATTGVARSRPEEEAATAPRMLGKKQQTNLAQGFGEGGTGVWVFLREMEEDHVCGVE